MRSPDGQKLPSTDATPITTRVMGTVPRLGSLFNLDYFGQTILRKPYHRRYTHSEIVRAAAVHFESSRLNDVKLNVAVGVPPKSGNLEDSLGRSAWALCCIEQHHHEHRQMKAKATVIVAAG